MADDPKARPGRLRPTIIDAPVRHAKAAAPVVRGPTAIPGVERRRIVLGQADLSRLCPGVAPQTAARAVRLVDGFVVEEARDHHVDLWGHKAQQDGAALVEDAIALAAGDLAPDTRGHVDRIAVLLDAIDLETPRSFAAARAELDQLIHLVRTALAPLQQLRDTLADHARRLDAASLEIEAAALAALFLSEHLAASRPELARRFLQREMSLSKTAVDIRASQFERDSQAAEPRVLVAAIEDVLLAALPGWLGDAATLIRSRRSPNPTQTAELQNRLRAILRQLPA